MACHPFQTQAIIWTNDNLLLIGPFRINLNKIQKSVFTQEKNLKMLFAKTQPFHPDLNVLKNAQPGKNAVT